jgi:hypothetical protein
MQQDLSHLSCPEGQQFCGFDQITVLPMRSIGRNLRKLVCPNWALLSIQGGLTEGC